MASSRTVTTWPSAGRPVEFLKTDFCKPERAGAVGHQLGEILLRSGHAFGNDDAAVIGRLHDDALDQRRPAG